MANKFNMNQLLNNASKKVAGAGSGSSKGKGVNHKSFRVTLINVNDLIPSKDNFYSVENIEELKMSIEMFGVKQNLVVKPEGDGKYKVIAGHRRRLATLALVEEGKQEFEFIPCMIEEAENEIIEKLLLITTNATIRQLSDWEKVEQTKEMKELLEEYKKSEKLPGRIRDIIAETLNTSPSQVGRMDAIANNLSEDFKEELKMEKLNISTAYELSGLTEEDQKEVFEEYEEKGSLSIKDVKQRKEELKKEGTGIEEQERQVTERLKGEYEEQEKGFEIVKGQVAVWPEEEEENEGPRITKFELINQMSLEELAWFLCKTYSGTEQENFKTKELCAKWLNTPSREG